MRDKGHKGMLEGRRFIRINVNMMRVEYCY